jgi:hypothetical protein
MIIIAIGISITIEVLISAIWGCSIAVALFDFLQTIFRHKKSKMVKILPSVIAGIVTFILCSVLFII